jgi:hypothetical protein
LWVGALYISALALPPLRHTHHTHATTPPHAGVTFPVSRIERYLRKGRLVGGEGVVDACMHACVWCVVSCASLSNAMRAWPEPPRPQHTHPPHTRRPLRPAPQQGYGCLHGRRDGVPDGRDPRAGGQRRARQQGECVLGFVGACVVCEVCVPSSLLLLHLLYVTD